jgi:hypothetical protein
MTEQETLTTYTRVAWFNRETNEYNFGAWHSLLNKKPKDYHNLQKWVEQQNKTYPRTKYWIEMKDTLNSLPKNAETYELIPITKEDDNNKTSYTEWLAL